jgi:class 3 adenylate cyclase
VANGVSLHTVPLSGCRSSHGRRSPDVPSWLDNTLFKLPPDLSRAEAKQTRVVILLATFGFVFHLQQGIYFHELGLERFALANLASILSYAVTIGLCRSGRTMLGVLLMGIELFLYINAVSVLLGARTGFGFYFLTITVGAYMVFRGDQTFLRRLWLGSFFVGAAVSTPISFLGTTPAVLEGGQTLLVLNGFTNALVLWLGTGYFAAASERAEAEAEQERQRSERLLLNVLPAPIAERLKDGESSIADHFPSVSVLFSDIVGFTKLSAAISTDELIEILNDIFSSFDRLAKKHGLEKIKTIGDAYMVVGGLPAPLEDHAARMVQMGLDMAEAIKPCAERAGHAIDVRIGIHTGPVVAGVIGVEKFAYDLWGDTVNTASRMESHGAKGRVQISAATREAIGEQFELEARGTIEVKGKGAMETYFVVGPKA